MIESNFYILVTEEAKKYDGFEAGDMYIWQNRDKNIMKNSRKNSLQKQTSHNSSKSK